MDKKESRRKTNELEISKTTTADPAGSGKIASAAAASDGSAKNAVPVGPDSLAATAASAGAAPNGKSTSKTKMATKGGESSGHPTASDRQAAVQPELAPSTSNSTNKVSANYSSPLVHIISENKYTGGQLNRHKAAWQAITSDTTILNLIEGYELEFENSEPPVQPFIPRPYKLGNDEVRAVNEEIDRLHAMGVIEHSLPESGEFISNIFTRKKKDGGYRMILDLSYLNKFITYHHFKMDCLDTALKFITKDCFMASIDLRDAYYSIPIAAHHKKYLKFRWNGTLWQFRALPNGLSSGPRIFTKLLKPPLATMRSYGHTVIAYIDDTLLVAKTRQSAKEAVGQTAGLFSELGFTIHPTKSVTEPVHEIKFLGFVINSHTMEIRPTEEKAQEISDQCAALSETSRPTIRLVSSVIGKLVATFPGVQQGPLHYRSLEKDKIWSLRLNRGHFDRKMTLTHASVEELKWWIENVTTAKENHPWGTHCKPHE